MGEVAKTIVIILASEAIRLVFNRLERRLDKKARREEEDEDSHD